MEEFVRWIASWYLRPIDGRTNVWSEEWWDSDEVCMRFEVLWRSYEVARVSRDAAALSNWILDHLDPHMKVILSPDGPFYAKTKTPGSPNSKLRRLPVVEAPEGRLDMQLLKVVRNNYDY
ncbi:MAG: DUF4913 domain-containing protein [Propionibacteriaceae bacterium]|nr:DUF4913 domain-containing protein [Propionibacteriaceae bacterium]